MKLKMLAGWTVALIASTIFCHSARAITATLVTGGGANSDFQPADLATLYVGTTYKIGGTFRFDFQNDEESDVLVAAELWALQNDNSIAGTPLSDWAYLAKPYSQTVTVVNMTATFSADGYVEFQFNPFTGPTTMPVGNRSNMDNYSEMTGSSVDRTADVIDPDNG